jgi:dTDP-4-dehydrorhamnose reductase
VKCFSDEFRCFLYVQDLARVIRAVIHAHYAGELKFNQRLLHVGGPEGSVSSPLEKKKKKTAITISCSSSDPCIGLSRSAFARKVAAALQLPDSLVVESRQLDTVTAYPRPPNLSMDCSRIRSVLNLELTPVDVALSEIYQKRCC